MRTATAVIKQGKAPVAQLDRASDYGSEGLGFESLRACFLNIHGLRAQKKGWFSSTKPAFSDSKPCGGKKLAAYKTAWGRPGFD